MKGKEIILDEIAGRQVAVLLVGGRIEDLLVEAPGQAAPGPGSIFRAVADRPLKGQGGMMMKLPDGARALFRNAKGLSPGTEMLVQVTSYAEPGKAIAVTDKLIFKGRHLIVTPDAKGINISRQIRDEEARIRLLEIIHASGAADTSHGLIVRSAAENADEDEIADEVAQLLNLADAVLSDSGSGPELLLDAASPHDLVWRDWPSASIVQGLGQHHALDDLAALDSPEVKLGSGSIFVEPTRALVAVDVNTGGDFSPAAGLKANLACAKELPRQLRLRGLGGQITIDLAPMPKKDRKRFESELRAALRSDPVETALVGWTPLGHYELQRKRERLPLQRGLFT